MKCANPKCGLDFIPRRPQQQYHNIQCLRAHAKRLMRASVDTHRARKAK